MISKELFVCIRFSEKASEKMRDSDVKELKKKLEDQFVKPVKKVFQKYDKKVKMWVELG